MGASRSLAQRVLVAVLTSWLAGTAVPSTAHAADCQFTLGFAALASALPRVGSCIDGESHNPANGDALQHTTSGLLVWRKADNWTAFTDGFRTWINGPNGIQQRLNRERFPWEAGPPVIAIQGAGHD